MCTNQINEEVWGEGEQIISCVFAVLCFVEKIESSEEIIWEWKQDGRIGEIM